MANPVITLQSRVISDGVIEAAAARLTLAASRSRESVDPWSVSHGAVGVRSTVGTDRNGNSRGGGDAGSGGSQPRSQRHSDVSLTEHAT